MVMINITCAATSETVHTFIYLSLSKTLFSIFFCKSERVLSLLNRESGYSMLFTNSAIRKWNQCDYTFTVQPT